MKNTGKLAVLVAIALGAACAANDEASSEAMTSGASALILSDVERCAEVRITPSLAAACSLAATTTSVTAAPIGSATAPSISPGVAYGVKLPADAGQNGGQVSFQVPYAGEYVIYLGTPNVPFELSTDTGASVPLCSRYVDAPLSAGIPGGCNLKGAYVVSLTPGIDYRVTLGPIAPQRWIRVVVVASDPDTDGDGLADRDDPCPTNANLFCTGILQSAVLRTSNIGNTDNVGGSITASWEGHPVAIDGDTLAIGVPFEDSAVAGDPADNSLAQAGAVYVFVRDAVGNWVQQAYLKASNPGLRDYFGSSVALSGDTLVATAIGEDSAATGIDGNQNDETASGAGAAYVFTRDASGQWGQQAYLKPSNTEGDDEFGSSVAISGDTVVVGAHREDSSATGVNGAQGNNGRSLSGAAYVYTRDAAGQWSQEAYLKPVSAGTGDLFGTSMAFDGATLVVGAPEARVPGGNPDAGRVSVFTRAGGQWIFQAEFASENLESGDHFGSAVAFSGSTLIVGAPGEDSNASGIDGEPNNNLLSDSGAAYVFSRDANGQWAQVAYLKASNPDANDNFGLRVGLSGELAAVSARFESSAALGIDGDGADNSSSRSGAAYVFRRNASGHWGQSAYVKPDVNSAFQWFGSAVAVSGTLVAVGAQQDDRFVSNGGALYLFE